MPGKAKVQCILALAFLVATLCACTRTDDEAVRHVVTAELMERYNVNEHHIRVAEIHWKGKTATVRAEVFPTGRSGTKRDLTCAVERVTSSTSPETSWTVTALEDTTAEEQRNDSRPVPTQ